MDSLEKDGFCVLDSALPPGLPAKLRQEFEDKYSSYLDERRKTDMLTVGDRRYMISVELSGEFAHPTVYANPCALSVARGLLGPDCILENFGVVASLPGAHQQHIHRDGDPLFGGPIAGMIPPYAVTVVFPLIEMNDLHGTTALVPGTHRYRKQAETSVPETPIVPEGSCVLWDYRLLHGGTANRSETVRPIVYLTYARKWWRDADNFKSKKQERLLVSSSFLENVPEEIKHLFSHV